MSSHSHAGNFYDTEYRVTFSIDFNLEPGESLAISGDLPSLGMWTDFSKFDMVRASGNSYVSAKPFITDKYFFQYKYVIIDANKQLIRWEKGVNRIADLEVLNTVEHQHRNTMELGGEYMKQFRQAQIINGKKVKTLRLDDEAEAFTVRFRVHIPEYHPNAEMRLMMKDTIIRDKAANVRDGEGYRMFNS